MALQRIDRVFTLLDLEHFVGVVSEGDAPLDEAGEGSQLTRELTQHRLERLPVLVHEFLAQNGRVDSFELQDQFCEISEV